MPLTSLAFWLVAFVALAFANGEHANAFVAWIAPVLVLRFVRTRPGRPGLVAAWLGVSAAWAFAWHAVFRAEGVELVVAALAFGAMNVAPYLADRAVCRRLPTWAGTLVLPCAWIALEFALAHGPFGAWGMAAYTQSGFAPVAQLAALAGPWGIGFLILWTAAVANAAWAAPRDARSWRAPAIALGVVATAALAFGAWRVAVPPPGASLRVALVLPPVQDNLNYDEARAPAIEMHLRAATMRAASLGAKLVVWPEDSFFAAAGADAGVQYRLRKLARLASVHVAATYSTRLAPARLDYENLSTLVAPTGELLWRYAKSNPVAGYEVKHMRRGDGRIARSTTSLGTLAGMICFDADHPAMLRQLLPDDVLLLVPSDDWPAIARLHPAMLRLRAIEQGIPIVRPTINGRSVVFDARGREHAEPARAADEPWLVDVPRERLDTPYARTGDAFAWACLAGLLALLAWGWRRRADSRGAG